MKLLFHILIGNLEWDFPYFNLYTNFQHTQPPHDDDRRRTEAFEFFFLSIYLHFRRIKHSITLSRARDLFAAEWAECNVTTWSQRAEIMQQPLFDWW